MLRPLIYAIPVLLLTSVSYAASPAGIWQGSYVCTGIERNLTLQIEAEAAGELSAVFSFEGSGASGSYILEGTINEADGTVSLAPMEWIDNPNGFAMVGLEGTLTNNRLEGRVASEYCGQFAVARAAGDQTEPETGPEVTAAAVAIPSSSPLAPFEALAQNNPAAVPGADIYPFVGNWAIDIPGGAGIWTVSREIDYVRQIVTDSHELTIGVGAGDAGVLQISADGRYRIAWLTGKWEGTWAPNTDPVFPESILLQHPSEPEDNWIIFRNAEGEMEAREYPYSGLSSDRLHPIQTAALAEYLLASLDPASLVGEWNLHDRNDRSYVEGTLSVTPDGQYRLVDNLMGRQAAGTWRAEGEYLVLVGGWWSEGDAYLKFGDPGEVTVISGGAEWVGVRP